MRLRDAVDEGQRVGTSTARTSTRSSRARSSGGQKREARTQRRRRVNPARLNCPRAVTGTSRCTVQRAHPRRVLRQRDAPLPIALARDGLRAHPQRSALDDLKDRRPHFVALGGSCWILSVLSEGAKRTSSAARVRSSEGERRRAHDGCGPVTITGVSSPPARRRSHGGRRAPGVPRGQQPRGEGRPASPGRTHHRATLHAAGLLSARRPTPCQRALLR